MCNKDISVYSRFYFLFFCFFVFERKTSWEIWLAFLSCFNQSVNLSVSSAFTRELIVLGETSSFYSFVSGILIKFSLLSNPYEYFSKNSPGNKFLDWQTIQRSFLIFLVWYACSVNQEFWSTSVGILYLLSIRFEQVIRSSYNIVAKLIKGLSLHLEKGTSLFIINQCKMTEWNTWFIYPKSWFDVFISTGYKG